MVTLKTRDLHARFLEALSDKITSVSDLGQKPLLLDLQYPLPPKVRLYLFNITHPPGGRTPGEHKIQIIIPGQKRGERAELDHSNGRLVILAGYSADSDVFVVWDAELYPSIPFSRNVQAHPDTVYAAAAGRIAIQKRRIRGQGVEKVIAAPPNKLREALQLRFEYTLSRLLENDE